MNCLFRFTAWVAAATFATYATYATTVKAAVYAGLHFNMTTPGGKDVPGI
jgi:hypothetical protein